MNLYCGTDIIEVDRVKKAILSTPNFKEKIFTSSEISYAENKSDVTKYQHYAGRFAAKEAVYKSLSKIDASIHLSQIEILNDSICRPYVVIHNACLKNLQQQGKLQIDISISHIKDIACANAIAFFKS